MNDFDERVDRIVSGAETYFQRLEEDEDDVDLRELMSDLRTLADEAEDVLDTVDVASLLQSLDVEEVPEAVELDDLPDAIQESDPTKAVKLRKLLELADLSQAVDSADLRELWREKREFDDAKEDVLAHDADGESGEDDLVDVDVPDVDVMDSDGEATEKSEEGMLDADVASELSEKQIQRKVSGAVDEFRSGLIGAHLRLKRIEEQNREKSRQRRESSQRSSRNPTAVSTMPRGQTAVSGDAHYSTVPRETKYSSAPNRERIYGDRFEAAAEEEVEDE